ncbi:MAG: response regulator [Candidatus Binatia bacterium]
MENNLILLVEDNPDDVALTLRAFKKANIANQIIVANNGVEALDFLFGTGSYQGRDISIQPEIILLDLKLPKLDGFEVLRTIRCDLRTKLLPVIVLTSSKEQQDVVESYGLGANSYVRKPVDFEEFQQAVVNLGLFWLLINESPCHPTRH